MAAGEAGAARRTPDGGSVRRGESFAAWRRYLEELAARSPLVVAIEDLHWADAAMLEFTNHLADEGGRVPMLSCARRGRSSTRWRPVGEEASATPPRSAFRRSPIPRRSA